MSTSEERDEKKPATRARKPSSLDIYVGARVKLRRSMMGMTQEKLGQILGVTFQQIQKYERGVNRISASRMQQIAQALDASLDYFYEGAPAAIGGPGFGEDRKQAEFQSDFLSSPEGIQLNRSFMAIKDQKVRRSIIDLVRAVAANQDEETSTRNSAVRESVEGS